MNDFAFQSLQEFYKLCEIPHCSFHTQDMFSYLCTTLTHKGYQIQSDEAKNIYAKKGNPHICLQSHYDMVCVGDCTQHKGIQTIQKDNFLYAKNSSLGADNGIGMACMLAQNAPDIELLFTNDEEVGMIGAHHLGIKIESSLLLNLDSEDINEIVLGCAGGVDIECHIDLRAFNKPLTQLTSSHPYIYHITSRGFLGGHSGIDIHKNNENVITEFGFFLASLDAYILTLQAGEKRNSIPTGLDSIIACAMPLKQTSFTTPQNAIFDITPLKNTSYQYAYHKNAIVPLICGIHSGVYAASSQGTLSSLNLSLIIQQEETLKLIMMARANTDTLLQRTIKALQNSITFLNPHCSLHTSGFYSPWEKSINDNHPALILLQKLYTSHHINPHIAQIHAGLECGILKRQLLALGSHTNLDVLSIGPTIRAPHSVNECLDMRDFEIFCAILHDFITSYKAL
ncbi:M20/M25/M40 family metallo-hydrolase [Helicobacter sp. MIT 21-1697]|uniref:M20/M25/M40 family metallo-hydrolase n=1 Tax=Helicobacter sp. MIT 21-1697 TaxID=2993733 RepID=UPI00224A9EF8|nr:M20/M25/M40 family metallo-hydrolase [Helicobacter sp. MIT 21-1697]MCX2716194.1 M20/M25/M40 family metallo-hydrolase [Helicobacter sp. MIT 21-1697]